MSMGEDFSSSLEATPMSSHATLAPVGYTGFRWATQIDPIWNAYLLGLVLSLAERIEDARIPKSERKIFSYRYEGDSDRLFELDGWTRFQSRSRELAEQYPYVVTADIADFYPRLYHHRIENALQAVDTSGARRRNVMKILGKISNSASYGLPVGGPAARMLSELTINEIDLLMEAERGESEFCRFADDYRMFVRDVPTAYRMIGSLSDKLHSNQGLSLQKSKTAIYPADEYLSILDPPEPAEGSAAKFLSLHLHFDPYSETPVEDYDRLRNQLEQFDILDLLRRELVKGQVHASVTKKLVKALRFLDEGSRELAIRSLLDEGNFERLAPVMPHVLMSIHSSLEGLSRDFALYVASEIRRRIDADHYIVRIELNLAYMIRVLSTVYAKESELLLIRLFNQPHGFRSAPSPVIQRDIMLLLARWGARYWVTNQRSQFQHAHPWVRRAFEVASFTLEDEGRHWRQGQRRALPAYDQIVLEWASERINQPGWEIPL